MSPRPATADDLPALARVHAQAFDDPWNAADIGVLMDARGGFALAAEAMNGALAGFILCRSIAGEAEILTLAVAPAYRRQGIARALTEAALGLAAPSASSMFLEVAADNAGAIALYEQLGFATIGRRARYYARRSGDGADALVMRRALNS
jgi:ribosomal-protein-alanine N-acetyltransferase